MKIIRIAREYGESLFKICIVFISADEYIRRMMSIGWEVKDSGSHKTLFSPINPETGRRTIVGFSSNNWDKNWKKQRQDLRRALESRDMDFIFESPFLVPDNFNIYTLKLEDGDEAEDNVFKAYFNQLPSLPIDKIQVYYNGQWKDVEDYDFQDSSIMFSDLSIGTFTPSEEIKMREN